MVFIRLFVHLPVLAQQPQTDSKIIFIQQFSRTSLSSHAYLDMTEADSLAWHGMAWYFTFGMAKCKAKNRLEKIKAHYKIRDQTESPISNNSDATIHDLHHLLCFHFM